MLSSRFCCLITTGNIFLRIKSTFIAFFPLLWVKPLYFISTLFFSHSPGQRKYAGLEGPEKSQEVVKKLQQYQKIFQSLLCHMVSNFLKINISLKRNKQTLTFNHSQFFCNFRCFTMKRKEKCNFNVTFISALCASLFGTGRCAGMPSC